MTANVKAIGRLCWS